MKRPERSNSETEAATLDFLGYSFRYEKDRQGRPWRYLNLFPSKKSLEKEREKIRELTGPKQCFKPVSELVEELNEHLAGWKNYFKVGYCRREFRKINYFVQCRMIKHLNRRSQRGYKLPKETSVSMRISTNWGSSNCRIISVRANVCDEAHAGKP